jgi:hypothetical protein
VRYNDLVSHLDEVDYLVAGLVDLLELLLSGALAVAPKDRVSANGYDNGLSPHVSTYFKA